MGSALNSIQCVQRSIMQHQTQLRYFWDCRPGAGATYVLIDRVTANDVASITYMEGVRRWRWSRRTSLLLHGAIAAEGTSKLLSEAKAAVQAGLPSDM
jgi:hypothetical protein